MAPIELAFNAMNLSRKIYGDKTLITNQTMLTYAMALTKREDSKAKAEKWFEKTENLF